MYLPAEYVENMKVLLGPNEYEDFISSYSMPRTYGLRVNTLKTEVERYLSISPFDLLPVPWTKDGFYFSEEDGPGKHPHYYAGLYYIQEPSAMFPAVVLDPQPGERVLDLCAAPGGKSVQAAALMKNRGLLVANDLSSKRTKALVKNLELCGVKNAVVTVEHPRVLALRFNGYFDRILVDAPCSGEGMFRKDKGLVKSWDKYRNISCAGLQREILESAVGMLKPGGILVYSTCTFAPEENENSVSWVLDKYRDMEVEAIPPASGIESGRPEWAQGLEVLKGTARLWPHKIKGEGHFVARLKKSENSTVEAAKSGETEKKPYAVKAFEEDNLNISINGNFITNNENVYMLPGDVPCLDGIKAAKFGWFLGQLSRHGLQPSHSFIMGLSNKDLKRTVELGSHSLETEKYLKGETLNLKGDKGLCGVTADGFNLGWAKQTGVMLKNLYPRGWRKLR